MVPGELSYKQGAKVQMLAISGGYAEVLDNVMTVLAPAAEFAAEIDTTRAQRAKERAEKSMAELNPEEKEFEARRGRVATVAGPAPSCQQRNKKIKKIEYREDDLWPTQRNKNPLSRCGARNSPMIGG